MRRSEERARRFDQEFGVDTTGYVHPTQLTVTGPNQIHAVAYNATDPDDFRDSIHRLEIDYPRFTFVDFGSGKGRTLLLATEFQFQAIVGVEFSEELHRIAQENITRFGAGRDVLSDVKTLYMDAAEYSLPNTPLVCYFCNPFGAPVFSQVIMNIENSFRSNPRDILIVYYNAKERHLFDESNWFQRIETGGWARVWKLVPEMKMVDASC
jgi:hypothetical protein